MKLNFLLYLLISAVVAVGAADQVLTPAPEQLEGRYRAKVTPEGDAIRIVTDTPEWDSGLRINPPKGGKFDFSNARYLAVDVENLSADRQMRLTMHISSGSRDKGSSSHVDLPLREINTGIGLNPGEKRTKEPPSRRKAAPVGLCGLPR